MVSEQLSRMQQAIRQLVSRLKQLLVSDFEVEYVDPDVHVPFITSRFRIRCAQNQVRLSSSCATRGNL